MKYFTKIASKFDVMKFLKNEKLMGKMTMDEAAQLGKALEEVETLHNLGKVHPILLQQLGKSVEGSKAWKEIGGRVALASVKTAKKKKKKDTNYLSHLGVGTLGAVIGGVLLKRYGAGNALAVNMPKMEIPKSKWAKYFEKMRAKMKVPSFISEHYRGTTSAMADKKALKKALEKRSEDKSFIQKHPVLTAAGTGAAIAGGIGIGRHINKTRQINAFMRDIKGLGYKLTKEEEKAARVLAEEFSKLDFNKLKSMI